MNNDALKTWQEKKHYLEKERAITADANQKFALRKQIEECEREIARLQPQPPNPHKESKAMKDVFICHASEDKPNVVRPLHEALKAANVSSWLDEAEIQWGDSITQKVNEGLASSRYVIVVLSEAFLNKNWPQRELNAVLNIEASSGEVKVLPLLVGESTVLNRLPLLNDKLYLSWRGDSQPIVEALVKRLGNNPTPYVSASPQETPTTRAVNTSTLQDVKRKALTKQLASLHAQHEAANDQYISTLNASDKVTLKNQIEKLEQEIEIVEKELNDLQGRS